MRTASILGFISLICISFPAFTQPVSVPSSATNRPPSQNGARENSRDNSIRASMPQDMFEVIGSAGMPIIIRSPNGMYRSPAELPQVIRRLLKQSNSARHPRPVIASPAATFVVTDPGDASDDDLSDVTFSPQTLRSAIENANKRGGAHTIAFSPGLTIISPATSLPAISVPITIDGTVSAGKIVLDGSACSGSTGLLLSAMSNVQNVIFKGWKSVGLALGFNAGGSVVARDEFTLNRVGLNINSANNTIGGENPGDRNTAYDNTQDGFATVFANDNTFRNNFSGSKDGLTRSPNGYSGIYIDGLRNRVIENLLSGNTGAGLEIGEHSENTLIQGNLIGADTTRRGRLPNYGDGISTFADRDSIVNNIITSNGWGITVLGQASETHISGNIIGPNGTLDSLFGNAYGGIQILGRSAVVDSNIISANKANGILITGYGGAVVRRNMIGTDPAGTNDWGNSSAGIYILTDNNIIGGPNDADRNILSGNGGGGIEMYGGVTLSFPPPNLPNYVQGNMIEHNLIGTDITGTLRIPNFTGLWMSGYVDSNYISRNLISGNQNHGIWTRRSPSIPTRNTFQGNIIGAQPDGVTPLPNDSAGVVVDSAGTNLFGGPESADGNIVAYSNQAGIIVKAGSGWNIRRNSIFKNAGLGIDLGNNGPTPNDSADIDLGANRVQNYPRITWIGRDGGTTTVKGNLSSRPNSAFRLEFYTNDTGDTTGFGEGQTFQRTMDVVTNAQGIAAFEFTLEGLFAGVYGTATDPDYGTSEFSKTPLVVNSVSDRPDADPADGTAATAGPPVNGVPEVTLRSALQASNKIVGEDDIVFDIPGAGVQVIAPQSAFSPADDDVTIDGQTQPGYSPGSSQLIQVTGMVAGNNANGFTLSGNGTTVRAISISGFHGDGIRMTGTQLNLADMNVSGNKGSGVRSSDDVTIEGDCVFNNNGPSSNHAAIACDTRTTAGLWIAGWLKGKGKITASGNCGSGIYHQGREYPNESGIELQASVNASQNSMPGLTASGPVHLVGDEFGFNGNGDPTTLSAGIFMVEGPLTIDATGTGEGPVINVNGNSFHGISSGVGPVTLHGKAQISNNGAGVSPLRCFNREISGIMAEEDVHTGALEMVANGYDGLRSHGSIFVDGDLTVKDHPGRGVWATMNIALNGQNHLIENNRDQAMWAANGSIDVKGRLTVRENKIGGRHGSDDGPVDADVAVGAVMAYKDFSGEDVVIEHNQPAGLVAWDDLYIHGNAIVRNNALRGIFARDNLTLDGIEHNISGNGGDGLSNNNNAIRVKGKLIVEHNGSDESVTSGTAEGQGVIGQIVDLEDAVIRDNHRNGAVGFSRLILHGRGIVTGNGGSGLVSDGLAEISGGRVCENGLFGIQAPLIRMSGTQICQNGRGGVSGKVAGRSHDSAKAGRSVVFGVADFAPGSIIRGSAITSNRGDGVDVDHYLPFMIEGSNISDNLGAGVHNSGSGPVIAEGNWWGSSAGPAGAINGPVTATAWLSSNVGMHVGSVSDSIYVPIGDTGAVSIVAANWYNPGDSIAVTVSDDEGWMTGVESRVVAAVDSAPGVLMVPYRIPSEAAVGQASRVLAAGYSLSALETAAYDTFHLVVYEPALRGIAILRDTVAVYPGDTLRLQAVGIDQAGREVAFVPEWSGTGGTIISGDVYIAGGDTGLYVLRVWDVGRSLSDSASVKIVPRDGIAKGIAGVDLSAIVFAPTPVDSLASEPIRVTNSGTGILMIDSVSMHTDYFSVELPADIHMLRPRDTLELVIAFKPDMERIFTDTLSIYANGSASPLVVPVSGQAGNVAGVGSESPLPESYSLAQNYPNPFNPVTTIRYALPFKSRVELTVYNILGQTVTRLIDGIQSAGYKAENFYAGSLASGVYFYRISATSVDGWGQFTGVKKLILIK